MKSKFNNVYIIDVGSLKETETKPLKMGEYERDKSVSTLASYEKVKAGLISPNAKRDVILDTIENWGKMLPISIGLLSLCSIFKSYNIDLDYINLELEFRINDDVDLENLTRSKLIGNGDNLYLISGMTPSYSIVEKVCSQLKQHNLNNTIIFGGVHATSLHQELIKKKIFDIIVIGEGENTLEELIDYYWFQNKITSLNSISGITFIERSKIVLTKPRPLIQDLAILPYPSYELIPQWISDFDIKPLNSLVMASRGCVNRCTYCFESKFWEHKIRYFPPKTVIRNIKLLKEMFGMNYFHFPDSSLEINIDYLRELTNQLALQISDTTFMCNVSPHFINKEIANILLKANFGGVYIGIENGSNEILRRMKRPPFEIAFNAIKTCVDEGIPFIGGAVMVGFPGENEKSFKQSLENYQKLFEYCHKNGTILHINPTIFIPYPGTVVFNDYQKYGIKNINYDYASFDRSSCVHSFDSLSSSRIEEMYYQLNAKLIEWNNV